MAGWNPFYWYRRHSFAKKFSADPIYSIEDPIHVAALLIIGTAKLDGDITAEQKRVAQEQFELNFSVDSRGSSELFGSAAHLLAAPQLIDSQLTTLADRSRSRFSADQANSMVEMMTKVASAGEGPTEIQKEFIEGIRSRIVPAEKHQGTWS